MHPLPSELYSSISAEKQQQWADARCWLNEAHRSELKVYVESSREAALDVAQYLIGQRVVRPSPSGIERAGKILP